MSTHRTQTQTLRSPSFVPLASHGIFHEDPLLQDLRAAIRHADRERLTQCAAEAARLALRPETDARLSVLLMVEAAEALRMLAEPQKSENLLHSASAALPASSIDLLGMIKRCHAKLLLDLQQFEAALTMARQADSFEFVRASGAEPLLEGSDDMLTPDTWLLVAECALAIGDYGEGERAIQCAFGAIDREKQRWLDNFETPDLAAFDPAYGYLQEQTADHRAFAQLLQVVSALRPANRPELMSSLSNLKEHVLSAERPSAAIVSRIAVLLGEWIPQQALPPRGLNLNEAKRWADFADPERGDRFFLTLATAQEPSVELPEPEIPAVPSQAADSNNNEVLQAVVEKMATIFDRALHLAHQPQGNEGEVSGVPAPAPLIPVAGFAIGGALSDFNLFDQIEQASRARLTGYFHVTWNPSPFEEMITAGSLDAAAALGQGWLFLRDGLLIDATVGEPTWPSSSSEDLSPDVLQTRQAAKRQQATTYIRTLLQVAVASMKTEECAGQAYGYKASDIAERERLFDISDNTKYLLEMITAIEGGDCSAEAEDVDMEGSWEAVPAASPAPDVTPAPLAAALNTDAIPTAFLPILGASTRPQLLEALKMALEEFGGGKVFVQLTGGSKLLDEATSQPWSQADKLAAQDNSFHLSLADGLTLTVGVTTPLKEDLLRTVLEQTSQRLRLLRPAPPPSVSDTRPIPPGVIIASKAMRMLYERIATFAPHDGLEGKKMAHILITGETGVGKEIVAREIHRLSHRATAVWRGENLAGMPKELVRSAIFGHVKGSFTGATADQPGLLQQTEGGTLLLDEFGELDLHTQALLLRMLEEGYYSPVGSKESPRKLKTRLIFATNRLIDDERVFRQDIKYRCSIIRVPPLRERLEDIRPLAIHFAASHNAEIDEAALTWAEGQLWAGNVRELKSLIDEAAPQAARNRRCITLDDLAALSNETSPLPPGQNVTGDLMILPGETLETALERIKIALIKDKLKEAGPGHGNKTRLAKLLGLPRTTVVGILQKYRLNLSA